MKRFLRTYSFPSVPCLSRLGGKVLFLFLALLGCTDPYSPPSTVINYGFLVVDGVLSTAGDTTRFTLSRTRTLNSADTLNPERNATVSVDEENGNSHTLVSTFDGNYSLAPGLLDASKKLRMSIHTNDGKEYASEYVSAIPTPPIDSVSWKSTPVNGQDGVQIYVSTHDPANNTRFYLWRYEETWEYQSVFASDLIRIGDSIAYRSADQILSYCYDSSPSTSILINSTTALSQDVVSDFPLLHIPAVSARLSKRYSILVHQYALSKEAYQYYVNIQKNTENLGTIFGSLPVRVTGNFTCVSDPSIPVLGFFSATASTQQRIFIDSRVLPPIRFLDPYYASCDSVFIPLARALEVSNSLYLFPIFKRLTLVGYETGPASCADCRYLGGVLTPPPFW